MGRAKFYILDVFAESKYQGNQLAVFTDITGISDMEMQQLAREINFSETTFILSNQAGPNGFPVKIFTPACEVPFAGHPTIGTASVIKQEIIKKPLQKVVLDLKVGPITVTFTDDGTVWMKQVEPEFGKIFEIKTISEILGLQISEINERFPIIDVSTGLPTIIAPVKTLQAIKRIKVNKEKYFELVNQIPSKLILAFCPETYHKENQLNVRVFVDYFGIPEDPATGSGNGCLAGYLVKYSYFNSTEINIACEQGYEIQRPSRLYLKAGKIENKININVGGKVQIIAGGNLI